MADGCVVVKMRNLVMVDEEKMSCADVLFCIEVLILLNCVYWL